MLKVNEIFLSIQGEGISTGLPTIFVRLAECNLRCSYCDTVYSYKEGQEMTIEEIMEKVNSFKYKRVCLTGGEPLLQREVNKLLEALEGFEVNIETNGSVDLSQVERKANQRYTMDIKTPSSGEAKSLCLDNFSHLEDNDEIKMVIGNREDYLWTKEIISEYYQRGLLTYSPIYGKIDPKEIIQWILEDGIDARFQLQLHKVLWHPEERGV
ncbi:radical SAM protein [Alkaliphilus hydrothermalis]|uniref:7-carboxy-7-deazaguanine synthase n=1 Tax=Alkaliphilus hydrothermalis TaxID=1482730 RepID=A0ABS2NMF5_9FIRM|nr:radical SAM protein [Alkaliphilus hydrothermalis]MBM7614113.1 7-carboxy-7-deazaguanine synthase [Alkaliphilus hydrothermalis]